MNQLEILKKIGAIIAELKDQHTYLEAAGSSFNDLELELFMANANFLGDHIEILKKVHSQIKSVALPSATPVLAVEKVFEQRPEIPDYYNVEEIFAEDDQAFKVTVLPENSGLQLPETTQPEITQNETSLLPEFISENDRPIVEDASFTEQNMAEVEKLLVQDTSFIAQKTPEPQTELATKENVFSEPEVKFVFVQQEISIQPKTTIEPVVFISENDQPKVLKQEFVKTEGEPVLTLNERIAAQRARRGLDQLKTVVSEPLYKPVQDLHALISLNDKLLFVKELFSSYNLAYSEAINILNRYTTFEQAEQFLNLNYTVKNNWKEKPATTERFFDLLRKRFALQGQH